MSLNTRLRRFLEVSTALLLLLFLASALARRDADLGSAVEIPVVLHMRTLTFHCAACELVRNCGADCVTVALAEARRRGAGPCKTCGGICLARR